MIAGKMIRNFLKLMLLRPVSEIIFPVKAPPVILTKFSVGWMGSILSRSRRCTFVKIPSTVVVAQLSWRVRAAVGAIAASSIDPGRLIASDISSLASDA